MGVFLATMGALATLTLAASLAATAFAAALAATACVAAAVAAVTVVTARLAAPVAAVVAAATLIPATVCSPVVVFVVIDGHARGCRRQHAASMPLEHNSVAGAGLACFCGIAAIVVAGAHSAAVNSGVLLLGYAPTLAANSDRGRACVRQENAPLQQTWQHACTMYNDRTLQANIRMLHPNYWRNAQRAQRAYQTSSGGWKIPRRQRTQRIGDTHIVHARHRASRRPARGAAR